MAMQNDFISNVNDVVKPGQEVDVRVLEVDVQKKRLSLSMKSEQAAPASSGGGGGENVPARGQVKQARRG
eukprot:scaffold187863_cov36-Prasinocladus_malaysianus.AAC.1